MLFFKLFFKGFPSITDPSRRWALFQVALSFCFFFFASAFAMVAIDFSQIRGGIMVAAWIAISLGLLCAAYGIGMGIVWFKLDTRVDSSEPKLHDDIHKLITTNQRVADAIEKLVAKM